MTEHWTDGEWVVLTSAWLDGERQGETEDLGGGPHTYRSAFDLRNSFLSHCLQRYGTAEVTVSPDGRELSLRRPNGYTRYINLCKKS